MEDLTMGELLHFTKKSNNFKLLFEQDIKELAKRNNFPEGLTRHYAYKMQEYIRAGCPHGNTTTGFLAWSGRQKKAIK
jgi:hypothetical protein